MCKPSVDIAYICTASVLPGENKSLGKSATEPAVNINAADSPTILPIAKITPDNIAGRQDGSTTFEIVLSFPAPSPKLPSLRESGTAFSASCVVLIIRGNIIIDKVSEPASIE